MKLRILAGIVLLAFALLARASAEPLNDARLLKAIAMVETGDNAKLVGKAGDRTQYQMTAIAWRDVSAVRRKAGAATVPFSMCHDPAWKKIYVTEFLHLTHKRLKARLRRDPSVEEIYVVWNKGWGTSIKRGFRPTEASIRVANLYRSYNN